MKIKTAVLKEMVAKVNRCVTNSNLAPLSFYIYVMEKECGKLCLVSTNGTEYYYVLSDENVEGITEDKNYCVNADTFVKLINKFTSEFTEFSMENNILNIKANGSYKLELPLDENGEIIQFPNKLEGFEHREDRTETIKKSDIKTITESCDVSVNKDDKRSTYKVLSYIYCGDSAMASNRKTACRVNKQITTKPFLMSSSIADILMNMNGDDIEVCTFDTVKIFSVDNECLFSPIVDGIDEFPVDAINGLIDEDLKASCSVDLNELLAILGRCMIFVNNINRKPITLIFNEDSLDIKTDNCLETLPYKSSEGHIHTKANLDPSLLLAELKTHSGENIEIKYGSSTAIELVEGDCTQLIALVTVKE